MGAEEADFVAKYNDKEGVYLGVWPLVGSNEIEVAGNLREGMAWIQPTLPKDIEMKLVYDGTMFMRDAIQEISKTLVETMLIVGFAVFLFMDLIRTALAPLVAMPVSLIGAAIVMFAFGFSLNLTDHPGDRAARSAWWWTTRSSCGRTSQRHVQFGKSRIQAALVGARS